MSICSRLKAVDGEHEESLKNFKTKFLQDTEEEVTKAVEKLKRDEEKKIQDVTHEFLKREKQKIAEAVETERKIFEREFGNLTELHKVFFADLYLYYYLEVLLNQNSFT